MDVIGLMPQFGGALWTLLAFVVALSVIVAVHEYGHYIVGRWCGIRADVFSLGFGPVLASRVDRRGTRWQIAALPFGGYVKFAGDADAASRPDAEGLAHLDPEERRHTMLGAPLWARSLTVAAGPVFNFVFSALIFALFLLTRGLPSEPLTIAELAPVPGVQELAPGDELLAIEGLRIEGLEGLGTVLRQLPNQSPLSYEIRRGGRVMQVEGPHPEPALVQGVSPDSAAIAARIQPGDVVTAVNGRGITTFSDLREAVEASDGAPLALTVWRAGETLELTLEPRRRDIPRAEGGFETRWLIGVSGGTIFTPATERPGIGETLAYGVRQTGEIIRGSLSGLYHMIAGSISSCNLSGPIGIAQASGAMASQGAASFVWFIAVLSTAVGLLNLFPIPVLDGGHLVFFAYEAIARRPPSDGAVRILMGMGLAAILSLMLLGLTNDLFCV